MQDKEPALRILSLGAGVQSSTMALMADAGEFGVFTGNVLNTRNLFATIAALASKNPTGFKSFSYLVRHF